MESAAWTQSPRARVTAEAAHAVDTDPAGQVATVGAAGAIENAHAPRVAVAGHLFGKRRTVFAAVPIACVKPNPLQPRQHFDAEALQELAESIRARGLLQPIIVRRGPDGDYTLIAGERRLRAAELAGVGLVPAILSEDDLLEVAIEENLQREDLSPLEEAEALAALAQERGHSHAELAQVIHKSRPYVSNTLALTRLPDDVKHEVFRDARAVSREILISIARQATPEAMRALWKRVRLQSMSVRSFRQVERPERSETAIAPVLRATRRLGRALRALPEVDALSADDVDALRRSLARAERRIHALLAALPQVEEAGAKRTRIATAGGSAAG